MLHKLPDEIYKLIMSYIFVPKVHLHRYCGDNWNSDLLINKCYMILLIKNMKIVLIIL